MALSKETLQKIEERAALGRINANIGLVETLAEIGRTKTDDPEIINLMDMLVSHAQIIQTLSSDIEYLLEDRAELMKQIDVYQYLEQLMEDE